MPEKIYLKKNDRSIRSQINKALKLGGCAMAFIPDEDSSGCGPASMSLVSHRYFPTNRHLFSWLTSYTLTMTIYDPKSPRMLDEISSHEFTSDLQDNYVSEFIKRLDNNDNVAITFGPS
jgi:hypothetical protein